MRKFKLKYFLWKGPSNIKKVTFSFRKAFLVLNVVIFWGALVSFFIYRWILQSLYLPYFFLLIRKIKTVPLAHAHWRENMSCSNFFPFFYDYWSNFDFLQQRYFFRAGLDWSPNKWGTEEPGSWGRWGEVGNGRHEMLLHYLTI